MIDAVLTNRLDGSMTGPVNALVTWPIYTADGQHIVIPAGARFLGTARACAGAGNPVPQVALFVQSRRRDSRSSPVTISNRG